MPVDQQRLERLNKARNAAQELMTKPPARWENECETIFSEFRISCVHVRKDRETLDAVEDKQAAWRFICKLCRDRPFQHDRCNEVLRILMLSEAWMKEFIEDPEADVKDLPPNIAESFSKRIEEVVDPDAAVDPGGVDPAGQRVPNAGVSPGLREEATQIEFHAQAAVAVAEVVATSAGVPPELVTVDLEVRGDERHIGICGVAAAEDGALAGLDREAAGRISALLDDPEAYRRLAESLDSMVVPGLAASVAGDVADNSGPVLHVGRYSETLRARCCHFEDPAAVAPPVVELPTRPAGMAVVVQRCEKAKVLVNEKHDWWGEIGRGLILSVSFANDATEDRVIGAAKFLLSAKLSAGERAEARKAGRPAFGSDAQSVLELCKKGEDQGILVIPQASLVAELGKKDMGLSYDKWLNKETAKSMYKIFIDTLRRTADQSAAASGGRVPKVVASEFGGQQFLEVSSAGPFMHSFNF